MIDFPLIWIIMPVILIVIILSSWLLINSNKFENKFLRNLFVIAGASVGFLTFLLPFFNQPRFNFLIFNYFIGIPITIIGLIGRVYPMIYLRKKKTTTTISGITKFVNTGPYAIVRHPQYSFGIIMLAGWFFIWGAIFAILLTPLLILIIFIQARIEEKYILEKLFKEEYNLYKKQVGMLLPKIRKGR